MTTPRTAGQSSAKASCARTASSARTVLQVTDTHLLAPAAGSARDTLLGVDTEATLAAVLAQALGERRPDAIIASGDLAHDPEPETYRRLAGLVARCYQGPVLYLPGNHDLTAPFASSLDLRNRLALERWEIIAFDTHVDGRTEAGFGPERRREFDARIDASGADHLLLACHHHPTPVGCPWLDKDRIPGGAELLESLARHPRVRALVFGHVHQEVRVELDGLSVLGTPSTCFQFQPGSVRFALDRSPDTGRPGYRWLVLNADGALDSEMRRLTDFTVDPDPPGRS